MNTTARLLLCLTVSLASLQGACSDPVDDGANPDEACQPIAVAGGGASAGCFLPYPSSFYEKADSSTATGFRVNIPSAALPKNQIGNPFLPDRYNRLDGWSPASQIVANLGVKLDDKRLSGEAGDPGSTLKADSPTQLLDYTTGERVPHFAEVDKNTLTVDPTAPQAQVLLIHPLVHLKKGARYVVALRGLTDQAGQPVVVQPFQSLVAGKTAVGGRLAALAPRYDEIFALLDKQGVPRSSLTLAWDFTTASEVNSVLNMVDLRDRAFKRWADQKLTYQVSKVTPSPMDPHVSLTIEATYDVPSFLKDPEDPFSETAFDSAGKALDGGKNFKANMLLHVPACAAKATSPLPIVVYGHGNFGSRTELNSEAEKLLGDAMCALLIATDWVGQADGDDASFGARIASFDRLSFMFDRMQQGQLNQLVLARIAAQQLSGMKELGTLADGKSPLVDGKHVYYYGNSQGGIYGHTLLALSPDMPAGVLGVGGGIYDIMIWRSRDFITEKIISDNVYPDLQSQQILWALAQNIWDVVDPIAYAPHTVLDPLPDETGKIMAPKRVLSMEGRYDMQVPNVATRIIARVAGLPLLQPSIEPVWGIEAKAGPLDSAYTQWDFHAEPLPPLTNAPADKGDAKGKEPQGSTGHSVHESVRRAPEAIEMMVRFLKDGGKVENTCQGGKGPCDYPKP